MKTREDGCPPGRGLFGNLQAGASGAEECEEFRIGAFGEAVLFQGHAVVFADAQDQQVVRLGKNIDFGEGNVEGLVAENGVDGVAGEAVNGFGDGISIEFGNIFHILSGGDSVPDAGIDQIRNCDQQKEPVLHSAKQKHIEQKNGRQHAVNGDPKPPVGCEQLFVLLRHQIFCVRIDIFKQNFV